MRDIMRLNVEADMRILLSSIKPDVKQTCKNVEHYSLTFFFGKFSNFL